MQLFFLPTFSTPCMSHLLYLMFRCDFDVMESLEEWEGSDDRKAFDTLVALTSWLLWKARNNRFFECKTFTVSKNLM